MVKGRDTAIDFVKIVALFLVLNSHMSICYVGPYTKLATGGAIGDALFFFSSGFTLFLGKDLSFVNWYKRRITRIYPSIMAVAIIGALFFYANDSFADVLLARRYWFIQCILLLYPLLYLAKRYVSNHICLLCILSLIVLGFYPFFYNGILLYGGGYYRWAIYLLFMLLGAIIGKERDNIHEINAWFAILFAVLCVVSWYLIVYVFYDSCLHILSVLPLMGVTVCMYLIGRSKPLMGLFHSRVGGPVLISIGGLCLESYLIQKMIITDKLNDLFPLNILLIMICVIIASFIAKIFANLLVQVFDSQPINWRKILVLY